MFSPKQCLLLESRARELRDKLEQEGQDPPPQYEVVWIKRASQKDKSSKTLWIRKSQASELTNRRGHIHRSFVEESGASSLRAFLEEGDEHGWCPIKVQGSTEAFGKAVNLIRRRLAGGFEAVVSKEIWIPSDNVAQLIGKRGTNIQRLKKETKVRWIRAFQERTDESFMCPVEIQGRSESVESAVAYIQRNFYIPRLPSRPRKSARSKTKQSDCGFCTRTRRVWRVLQMNFINGCNPSALKASTIWSKLLTTTILSRTTWPPMASDTSKCTP